jgi:signal transduction histidine kinase
VEAPSDHDILLALGEDLPVGIWIARVPNGELVFANRMFTEILGISTRYDNLYTRDGALYPEAKLPFVRALTERRVIIADDLAVHRADGRHIDVRAVARPVGNPITHVVISFFDVSREVAAERARVESEQRLRRAQRLEAIGTLAGGISHDFNNLIFGIKLIAADLAATQQDPKVLEAMALIDDSTERSASLTRALMGFARRGKQRRTSVNLNDVVTSMSELLGRTLAGVELTFELEAAERGTVAGDQAQLEQVIMNLVLNARDAVHGQGRIVVRTSDRDPGEPPTSRLVVLEVKDDGAGMPDDVRARVLAPGFASAAAGADRGIGLPTVMGIVESHGGKLEIERGIDGAGATVRVVLPAVIRPPAPRSRITAADLPRGSGLVLVVDDDTMVRKVVSGSLASLGYKTVEAVSGTEAIEIYRERHHEIRAVVLDMVMTGMAGRATYLGLREINAGVAVLLMSGHTLNEQVQEILDLGVRAFVTKPYSIATLATAMAELTR